MLSGRHCFGHRCRIDRSGRPHEDQATSLLSPSKRKDAPFTRLPVDSSISPRRRNSFLGFTENFYDGSIGSCRGNINILPRAYLSTETRARHNTKPQKFLANHIRISYCKHQLTYTRRPPFSMA
uniref:Uncharacterized protein n=1 Tax=Bionectria ochroleuca TaxID=29856 RepID=A0A8H7TV26_BIOOC